VARPKAATLGPCVHGSSDMMTDVSRPRARRGSWPGWWNELPGHESVDDAQTLRNHSLNKHRESTRRSQFPETGAQVHWSPTLVGGRKVRRPDHRHTSGQLLGMPTSCLAFLDGPTAAEPATPPAGNGFENETAIARVLRGDWRKPAAREDAWWRLKSMP
jgi:hypothetical protein